MPAFRLFLRRRLRWAYTMHFDRKTAIPVAPATLRHTKSRVLYPKQTYFKEGASAESPCPVAKVNPMAGIEAEPESLLAQYIT